MRHQRDKAAAGRQVAEIGELDAVSPIDAAQLADLLVRPRQEVVEQAQLVHHLQGRGVDRVAAEIAQEIAVLLQHQHLHPGPRQQKAEHHPGRAAAGDAAGDAMWQLIRHGEAVR